jgi:segregation and condensation protein B
LDFLSNHIEALIFVSPKPIREEEIKNCLNEMFGTEVPDTDIRDSIQKLVDKYGAEEYAFQVEKIAGGLQFMTKPAYQSSIGILLKQQSKKRLSNSALETLAIIAYKQPITKTQLEQIRGVNCDYTTQKLLEKELIEIKGKAETPGRPLLFGTTSKFMEYFGINDINELPTPKDFPPDENKIGEEKIEDQA